jgi:hypothetical protein
MSKRTDAFTLTELRHMVAALRKHDVRELLAEFEAALDERIRQRRNSKRRRKKRYSQLREALKSDKFPWDYSYTPWKEIPEDVRREMVHSASVFGRCWIWGRTSILMDVYKNNARRLYNENWDGCRDLWKANYRARKHPGTSLPPRYTQTKIIGGFSGAYMELPASEDVGDPAPPAEPPIVEQVDPRVAEYNRQYLEREQAKGEAFNRRQKRCYRAWLRLRGAAHG